MVGQADTTVVVVNPGWGDAVQANKAGLMEIADVFVVNKADRPGRRGDRTRPRADARHRTAGSRPTVPGDGAWRPPVVCATATSANRRGRLRQAIADHRAHLVETGELARPTPPAGPPRKSPGWWQQSSSAGQSMDQRRRALADSVAAAISTRTAADDLLGIDRPTVAAARRRAPTRSGDMGRRRAARPLLCGRDGSVDCPTWRMQGKHRLCKQQLLVRGEVD